MGQDFDIRKTIQSMRGLRSVEEEHLREQSEMIEKEKRVNDEQVFIGAMDVQRKLKGIIFTFAVVHQTMLDKYRESRT